MHPNGEMKFPRAERPRMYSEQLDELDAAVFSGELLYENLLEFKEHVARWQRAIDKQEELNLADSLERT